MLSVTFEIQFTNKAQTHYNSLDANMTRRINRAINQLAQNPFFGPNIAKLKGSNTRRYRYRVGSYRIIYEVDTQHQKCFVISISTRGRSYHP
ncbi:type II toxin-antitoxin system RelE/ParE family toxin [Candidatus Poribacteria bacterium]|nr:type II toxin-antitoxin system RelE/ParE family toxin [Candidatus Poribacteria bacterium]